MQETGPGVRSGHFPFLWNSRVQCLVSSADVSGERGVIWCSVEATGFSRGQLCGVVLAAILLRRSSPPAVESVTDPGSCWDSSFVLNSARIIFCGAAAMKTDHG